MLILCTLHPVYLSTITSAACTQIFYAGRKNWPPYGVDKYQHNLTGEDNGDAHLKRTLLGREVVVAVTDGHLDFGPWETIFYGEFDGQRNKRILIKIIGE